METDAQNSTTPWLWIHKQHELSANCFYIHQERLLTSCSLCVCRIPERRLWCMWSHVWFHLRNKQFCTSGMWQFTLLTSDLISKHEPLGFSGLKCAVRITGSCPPSLALFCMWDLLQPEWTWMTCRPGVLICFSDSKLSACKHKRHA